jgi:hypothetical protein
MLSTTLNDLPEDVLMNIFARLPVIPLLRFKCICKPWYNVIRDPIFITKNVNQSALSNNGYFAITRYGGTFCGKCSISLISYETFREVITMTVPFKELHVKILFQIVGSCNSVLCLNVSKFADADFLLILALVNSRSSQNLIICLMNVVRKSLRIAL